MVKVIVTEHAQSRISERGGNRSAIVSAVNQAAPKILAACIQSRNRRVALTSPEFPTVPIVELSPRNHKLGFVVVTVLPQPPVGKHPVIAV
jgi:hypothetical protein